MSYTSNIEKDHICNYIDPNTSNAGNQNITFYVSINQKLSIKVVVIIPH